MTWEPGFLAWFSRQAGNHVWQSTAFAAGAFVVALALKATHARARHWVWLAASVKFLVPFGVLASLGSVLGSWVVPAAPSARVPITVAQVVQPFALPEQAGPEITAPTTGTAAFPIAAVLVAIWLIGFAAVLFHWWNRWRRIRGAVCASSPLREGREVDALRRLLSNGRLPRVELVSSSARLEPGMFGILRPVLWLPAGIADRLSEAELDAILAHELCHLRRRDNLWAAVHMAVEAIFWFHPLVWWLGARLIEERERACDEEVVRLGSEPQAYAEGVLKVCEFYLESPLACAAGVTGADLRKRIEGIMASRFIAELCLWKKALLAALLAVVVACPLLLGVFKAEAQTAQAEKVPNQPRFAVVSIHPVPSNAPIAYFGEGFTPVRQGGQYVYSRATLFGMIRFAYSIGAPAVQLLGLPEWARHQAYDVAAKPDAGFPVLSEAENATKVRLMMRGLLEERFGLRIHSESRSGRVFTMEIAKGGIKIKEVPAPPDPDAIGGGANLALDDATGRLISKGCTMSALANTLAIFLKKPVLDRTGLTGSYAFDIRWDEPDVSPVGRVSSGVGTVGLGLLISNVQRQLGLRIKETNGSVEYWIVDQVKQPDPN